MNNLQFIGIDISKDKFDASFLKNAERLKFKDKKFENNPKGALKLLEWINNTVGTEPQYIYITLEPTGVYHEMLAYFLYDKGFLVNVVNSARIPAFADSKGIVHKTDKSDSRLLARFGADNSQERWQPEPLEIRQLKAKVSRLDALKEDLQREKNRLEQAQIGHLPDEVVVSICEIIQALEQAIVKLEKDIDDHIDRHPDLKKDRALLRTIPGVGPVLSTKMMLLYRGHSFKKAADMAAFVGLIPRKRESGKYVGKIMLSKRGSAKLRAALYMPAVSAKTHNPDIKALCQRLIAKGKTNMQAIGAAMRRLVHICFGVLKHQSVYQSQTVNV